MLAGLVAQAEGSGGDLVMIRALVEEASEMGAGRALDRLGLSDREAEDDVRELRELQLAHGTFSASGLVDSRASALNSMSSSCVRIVTCPQSRQM